MPQVTLERAQAAKQAALRRFETLGQVVGVGITRVAGQYAVKVNLREPVDPGVELPTEIDGVPVRVEVTGSIRPRRRAVVSADSAATALAGGVRMAKRSGRTVASRSAVVRAPARR